MTLTQTAILVRKTITISAVALIITIVSFIGYKIWYAYYLSTLPPVEEIPDTKFGVLPAPDFPISQVSSSNFSYTLDTTTGGLPRVDIDAGFEKIAKVYFLTKTFASFLSAERSQALAAKFGINTDPQILTETKYRFQEEDKTLLINLDSGNFSYTKEATVSGKENLDDDEKLITDFKQVLANLGVLKEDLKNGPAKIAFFKMEGGRFAPTNVRAEAQVAGISLWPSPLDKKPIVTGNFNISLINVIVFKNANSLENYLALDFIYYPADVTTLATYPIKTAEAAFEDLRNGKGAVIITPPKPQVSITSVYLGYYLPENYNPYLQPVFVFEGPSFAAYVAAISEEFQFQAR